MERIFRLYEQEPLNKKRLGEYVLRWVCWSGRVYGFHWTKKAGQNIRPALLICSLTAVYFLNFLLNPASPKSADPKRSMVAGSGTGAEPAIFKFAVSKSAITAPLRDPRVLNNNSP